MLKARILATIAFLFYSALKATWRIRIHESDSFKKALASGEPMVFAHWHGDELGLVYLLPKYRSAAMASNSKDGEIMNQVIHLFGARTSRGSSSRGGASALKGMVRLAREGWRPSIAVDGPKGPYHKCKPGVFEVSRLVGGQIYPLVAAADRAFIFKKSWNKAFLPKPFAKVQIVWGEPFPAVGRDDDARSPELALRLEDAINKASEDARRLLNS